MDTDYADNTDADKEHKLIYKDLTYRINGVLFLVSKELGPYAREKQYSDVVKRIFKEKGISYRSEVRVGDSGNIVDGIVDDLVLLEFKAKAFLTREDYYQIQRYLQETRLKLGILVNFRDRRVRPKRIIRIEHWENRS